MCEPTTIIMAVSALVGMIGAKKQADAIEDTGKINAAIDRDKAADAIDRGVVEENNQRRQTTAIKAKQTSVLAANGVEIDSGSASDLLADTAQFGELDALTIRNNAEREAYYHETSARGGLASSEARATGVRTSALGDALSTGATVASKWYKPTSSLKTSLGTAVSGNYATGRFTSGNGYGAAGLA